MTTMKHQVQRLTLDLSKNYKTNHIVQSASSKASLTRFNNLQHMGDDEEEASNSENDDTEETKNV